MAPQRLNAHIDGARTRPLAVALALAALGRGRRRARTRSACFPLWRSPRVAHLVSAEREPLCRVAPHLVQQLASGRELRQHDGQLDPSVPLRTRVAHTHARNVGEESRGSKQHAEVPWRPTHRAGYGAWVRTSPAISMANASRSFCIVSCSCIRDSCVRRWASASRRSASR